MKRKYKNITIPYVTYNDNYDSFEFIYNDKVYTELSDLLKDYIGVRLVYHFKTDEGIKEVYDMEDVFKYIITNYKDFRIPNKYRSEYTNEEYKTIEHCLDVLNGRKEIKYERNIQEYEVKKKLTKEEKRWLDFIEEMKKYDYSIPKIVHSDVYNRDVYAFNREGYFSAISVLEEACLSSFYYQFDGDGIEDSYDHYHEHVFNDLIRNMFSSYGIIKIYDFQKQFYSNQELNIIYLINKKFKEKNFYIEPFVHDKKSYEKWKYYKDNNKKIRLALLNMKDDIKDSIVRKKRLKNHKR